MFIFLLNILIFLFVYGFINFLALRYLAVIQINFFRVDARLTEDSPGNHGNHCSMQIPYPVNFTCKKTCRSSCKVTISVARF
jgi:hypothetical protein